MNRQPAALLEFNFFEPLPIQIEVSDAPLTCDAGLLPLRQFDERIGLTRQFAAVLDDPRDPDLIEHSFTEMVRMRIFGILAGYEDQNDHDTLRTDAIFKLVAERRPPTWTWPASRRCRASRMRSTFLPSNACAISSSINSSPRSPGRRGA